MFAQPIDSAKNSSEQPADEEREQPEHDAHVNSGGQAEIRISWPSIIRYSRPRGVVDQHGQPDEHDAVQR